MASGPATSSACTWDQSGSSGENSETVLGIFQTEDEAIQALAGKENQSESEEKYDHRNQPCGSSSWVKYHLHVVKVGTHLWEWDVAKEMRSYFPSEPQIGAG